MDLDLSVTEHLLVACLRTEHSEETAEHLSRLTPPGWEELLKVAARQRVGPLLFGRLKSEKLTAPMPQAVRDDWQALYRANAVRNIQIHEELSDLLGALREFNISVIVLKGAWLASTVYGQPALRFMNDIDIMVSKADFARTIEVMTERGYLSGSDCTLEYCFHNSQHWPRMFRERAAAGVEVHWTLMKPGQAWALNEEELWQRAIPATIAECETLSLSPEDALLHFCLHLTYSHVLQKGISPLCDIDRTVRHYGSDLNYAALAERARTHGCDRGVHLALFLASELLNTPVPQEMLRSLEPEGFTEAIASAAVHHLLADNRDVQDPEYAFIRFFVETSPFAKIRLACKRLFAPPKHVAASLGVSPYSPRVLLHYPTRLLYLLKRYGSKYLGLVVRPGDRSKRDLTELTARRGPLEEWLLIE